MLTLLIADILINHGAQPDLLAKLNAFIQSKCNANEPRHADSAYLKTILRILETELKYENANLCFIEAGLGRNDLEYYAFNILAEVANRCDRMVLMAPSVQLVENRLFMHRQFAQNQALLILSKCPTARIQSFLQLLGLYNSGNEQRELIQKILQNCAKNQPIKLARLKSIFEKLKIIDPEFAKQLADCKDDGAEKTDNEFYYEEFQQLNENLEMDTLKQFIRECRQPWRERIQQKIDGKRDDWKKTIAEFTADDIHAWLATRKEKHQSFGQLLPNPELVSIVMRASQLCTGYLPRLAQLCAIIVVLLKTTDKGRILQKKTGEGKSLVISITAAIIALVKKLQIDIITSNALMAKRDCDDFKQFYQILGLTVDHTGPKEDEQENADGARKCYEADILLGDIQAMKGDLLRHEFNGNNTRGSRQFANSFVIVDEVDLVLIEFSNHITMLSEDFPANELLQPIYAYLWMGAQKVLGDIEASDDGGSTEKKYNLLEKDKDGHIVGRVLIPDLVEFLRIHLAEMLKDDVFGKLGQNSAANWENEEGIKNIDPKIGEALPIPRHLYEFVKQQKPKWIDSIIQSFQLNELGCYLIKLDDASGRRKAVPVDYAYTGVVQDNTILCDGRQQFLQLRHSLKLSPESPTTCFISTMKYLSLYKENFCGLTGTVGGAASRKLLTHKDIYNLDIVVIPTHKRSRFRELKPIFVKSKQSWLSRIAEEALKKAKKKALLIIMKEIGDVEELKKLLEASSAYTQKEIQVYGYARSDDKEQADIPNKIFRIGDIILSTCLGGRGTGIKLDNAVLHVYLTFFTENMRLELQNFGRTARCGQDGTAQLILNTDDLAEKFGSDVDLDIDDLRKWREQYEGQQIDNFIENLYPRRKLGDELFWLFCEQYQMLRDIDKEDTHKLKQVEELWGLKLRELLKEVGNDAENDEEVIKRRNNMNAQERKAKDNKEWEEAVAKLYLFINEIEENFKDPELRLTGMRSVYQLRNKMEDVNLELFVNPCRLIRRGIHFYFKSEYGKAIKHFERAIALDPRIAFGADYNMAVALLQSNPTAGEQKLMESATQLGEAAKVIATEINTVWNYILTFAPPLSDQQPSNDANTNDKSQSNHQQLQDEETDLRKQMLLKLDLLKQVNTYINKALDKIREVSGKSGHIVRVSGTVRLRSLYQDGNHKFGDNVGDEIRELEQFGVPVLYNLEVIKLKTPFWKRLLLFAAGFCQAALGFCLYFCGPVGHFFGKWLIMEGFQDMANAFTKDLSGLTMKDYIKNKGMSLAIYCTVAGLEKLAASVLKWTNPNSVGMGKDIIEKQTMTAKEMIKSVAINTAVNMAAEAVIDKVAEGVLEMFRGEMEKSVKTTLSRTINKNAAACKFIMGKNCASLGSAAVAFKFKWFLDRIAEFLSTKHSKSR